MDEAPGLSDQYRAANPWSVPVALGTPIFELSLLFGLFPLAVGGLFLFGGSVIGILEESGYVTSTVRVVTAFAAIFLAFGTGLAFTDIALVTRGHAVTAAAVLLVVSDVVFELFVHEQ